MLRHRAVAALAALSFAGCPSGDDPPRDFLIRLALDRGDPDASCATGASCSDFPIGCPIKVGIRLLGLPDPDDPEAALPVRDRKCRRTASPPASLCDLGDPEVLDITYSGLPPERGQIEFLVWRDLDPDGDLDCPEIEFDRAGRPIISPADPNPPAFGRRVFFDFGADAIAPVPLACSQPTRLDDPTCTPPATDLRVDVDDIDNLLLGVSAAKAPFLSVRVGQPTTSNGTDYEIVPEDSIELGRVQDNPEIRPFWEEQDVPTVYELGADICAIVTDFGSVPAVTCATVQSQTAVELLGYMVSKEDWDLIRAAIDLNVFPADGLILGRVVDTNMIPLEGAVVTPSEPASALYYLDADKTSAEDGGGIPLAQTSASGYFVARGPSFASKWTATRAGGWSEIGSPTGGALRQSLTIILIVMTQDLTP